MKNLRIHFITNASRNCSEALAMAMQLWSDQEIDRGTLVGIQEITTILNDAAKSLQKICEHHARFPMKFRDDDPDVKLP